MNAICIKRYRCKLTKEWVEVNTKLNLNKDRLTQLSNKGFIKEIKKRKRKSNGSSRGK